MPSEQAKLLEFNQYQNSDKTSFIWLCVLIISQTSSRGILQSAWIFYSCSCMNGKKILAQNWCTIGKLSYSDKI